MIFSPWLPVLLAVPVLVMGEALVRRIKVLDRFNIPSPVAGGLLVALVLLAVNLSGMGQCQFETKVAARWWTWLVTPEPEWVTAPAKSANLPFLVGFFTCIGLNASWALARRGSVQVITFLLTAAVLAVLQNVIGMALALLLGTSPLLGVVCGSVTMTGGHGTALGFAAEFEKAGLNGAAVLGVAAATFGLVSGGLLGGPVGGALIREHRLQPAASPGTHLELGQTQPAGILSELAALRSFGASAGWHLLLLLGCIKVGAWVSWFIQATKLTFPVYMGAMLVGVAVRNLADGFKVGWLRAEMIDRLSSVTLAIFLAMAMMSINLRELAGAALPMLIILCVQVVIMALFAWFVTFRVMGKGFDAAVMAGGHCGFGLGATPNAVANMKSLVETFGPAPRAFLVVPLVGAFLIDFLNALNITLCLNLAK